MCWAETYAPYGEKLDNEDKLEPADGCGLLKTDVGYTGHVQDGSGLVYAQQRYYDPVIGRFMSTDPTKPTAGDPRYFGRYQYGANSPYNYVDLNGREFQLQWHDVSIQLSDAPIIETNPSNRTGFKHSFISFVPDNPEDFASDSRFNQSGTGRTTFGAGPDKDDKLAAGMDRDDDIKPHPVGIKLTLPGNMTEIEAFDKINNTFSSYSNKVPYSKFGVHFGLGNNSNSFARSLLDLVGFEYTELPRSAPGINTPVDKSEFD